MVYQLYKSKYCTIQMTLAVKFFFKQRLKSVALIHAGYEKNTGKLKENNNSFSKD